MYSSFYCKCKNDEVTAQNARTTLIIHNLKSSFLSLVRPTVHTNLSRKRIFLKTLFKRRLKLCVLAWQKNFKNEAFRKCRGYGGHDISVLAFSSNANAK